MAAKTKKQLKRKYPFIPLLFIGIIVVIGVIIFLFFKKYTPPQQYPSLAQTYTGEFPCSDCSKIITTLMLTKSSEYDQEGTYILSEFYEGKTPPPIFTRGYWYITQGTPYNANAFILTLTQNSPSENTYYLIEGKSKITLLDSKKEKINSPFNESLTATSAKYQIGTTEVGGKIISQLPSWLPTVSWSGEIASHQQTFYGDLTGSEVTGMMTTKEPSLPHFENVEFLQSLGFVSDTNLAADGPGSSSWGYIREVYGKKQLVLFSYQTEPTSTNTNEPLQFTCPCKTKLTIFISNYFFN